MTEKIAGHQINGPAACQGVQAVDGPSQWGDASQLKQLRNQGLDKLHKRQTMMQQAIQKRLLRGAEQARRLQPRKVLPREIDRRLSNTALMLSQQAALISGWTKHHDTGIEQEVTAAVVKHLGDSAVPLETTHMLNNDGSILCEWEGVVRGMVDGKEVLVFVEAKHCIKAEHLERETNKAMQAVPLFAKLNIMQDWLTGLHEPEDTGNSRRQRQLEKQYDEYRRCKDFPIKGAIGGPCFDDSLQRQARKMHFMCVVCGGNRYAVL